MTDAPERIWAFFDGPMVGLFVSKNNFGEGSNVAEYTRVDLTPRWQPIDTAPNGRTDFLVGVMVDLGPDYGDPYWSQWIADGRDLGNDGFMGDPPTHWMPLPAPPEAT